VKGKNKMAMTMIADNAIGGEIKINQGKEEKVPL